MFSVVSLGIFWGNCALYEAAARFVTVQDVLMVAVKMRFIIWSNRNP
jgi:hypothetical protein